MTTTTEEIAEINAEFVLAITSKATDILRDPRKEKPMLIEALTLARNQFLKEETQGNHEKRTYSWGALINDLKWHLVANENADQGSWSPISDWEQQQTPERVADTLLDAGRVIAQKARDQTICNGKTARMTENQLAEHLLMKATAKFLRQHGIEIKDKCRQNPSSPIDYRATLDGVEWAFELTQLRLKDPEGTHRKVGHPKDKRTLENQIEELEKPIPQQPSGSQALQQALNNAVEHGQKSSKKEELKGAKYCLVIHNKHFLYIPDWEKITWPNLKEFDAVMILHDEMVPPVKVWEVIPEKAFGKALTSGTAEDVEKLALIQQVTGPEPETVKAAWERLAELNITENDILEAVRRIRTTKETE